MFDIEVARSLHGEKKYTYCEPFINELIAEHGSTVWAACKACIVDYGCYWQWVKADVSRQERYWDAWRWQHNYRQNQLVELMDALDKTRDPVTISKIRTQMDIIWKMISRTPIGAFSERTRVEVTGTVGRQISAEDEQAMLKVYLEAKGLLPGGDSGN